MFQILVVEDDINTRRLMCAVLERSGFQTQVAGSGREALEVLERKHIDLIVTDIMMPQMDGFELTEIIRSGGSTIPMLMVTAKETREDKRHGFRIGIDDYMVKPVDEEEMVLRIHALLRRSRIVNERKPTVKNVTLYYDAVSAEMDGERFEMPQKEFLLLYKLLSYPNKIFTRRQLMDEIWDMESESDERTVDVHISRLRDRFRATDAFEILTVRGLGYKAVIKA